jgi:hypothetical protein
MKALLTLLDGALLVQEQAGDFFVTFDGSLGGGAAAGIIEGKGTIKFGTGTVGLKLLEQWVNAHLPASVQAFAQMAEAALNSAVAGA